MANICPICNESATISPGEIVVIDCFGCGKYRITEEALENYISAISRISARAKANASGWLTENHNYLITTNNWKQLFNLKTPSFQERTDKLLLALEKDTSYAGEHLKKEFFWQRYGWCLNGHELSEMLGFLMDCNRISGENIGSAPSYKIAPAGWAHLEVLKKVNADSHQGFVAMWFDDQMQQIFDDAISPGIIDAGYKPHRADLREHSDKIDDEIITQIKRSRFVLADFTGQRGGVYYEAGFGKGLGLEVFWTCRKDEIEKLHFDIRQYNCIDWMPEDLTEFKHRISIRIESVLGRGTYQKD